MSNDPELTRERGVELRQVDSRQTRTWLLVVAAVAILAILAGNRPAGQTQESVRAAGISRINVDSQSARIVFSPGTSDMIGVDLNRASGGHELEVTRNGGILEVTVTRRAWPPRFLSFYRAEVEITLPPSAVPDINVEVRSGGVEAADVSLGNSTFSSRSGGIVVEDVTVSGDLDASASSGGIRMSETVVDGQMRAQTSSGGVTLDGVTAHAYRLGASSGRINASGLTGAPLEARVSSGRISLTADTLAGDWEVSASSGGVEVFLETPPRDMRVRFSGGSGGWSVDDSYGLAVTETGRNSFRASRGNGGPLIDVSTGSGRFRLR